MTRSRQTPVHAPLTEAESGPMYADSRDRPAAGPPLRRRAASPAPGGRDAGARAGASASRPPGLLGRRRHRADSASRTAGVADKADNNPEGFRKSPDARNATKGDNWDTRRRVTDSSTDHEQAGRTMSKKPRSSEPPHGKGPSRHEGAGQHGWSPDVDETRQQDNPSAPAPSARLNTPTTRAGAAPGPPRSRSPFRATRSRAGADGARTTATRTRRAVRTPDAEAAPSAPAAPRTPPR